MTVEVLHYVYGQTKPNTKRLAVALGFFDGVHLGHRSLLRELKEKSEKLGLTPCVFSFANGLSRTKNVQTILYHLGDKTQIFENIGIEKVIYANFESISHLTPEEFVNEVLIKDFGVELCVAGYNFRFGKGALGNADSLMKIMSDSEKQAIIMDEETVNGQKLSSSRIRELLSDKKIEEANALLGSPYFIKGIVEKGLGLGSHFGFPTVNTTIRHDSPLPKGVYRSAVKIGDKLYTGITNIGNCPTVQERETHAETLIADFDGNLYGEEIYIYLLEYLRDERTFESVELLKQQIDRDKEISISKNGDLKWLEIGLKSL